MEKNIDYKKLWFELCEEKKQLQIENHNLKNTEKYIRRKYESLERIHSKLIQGNWNKTSQKEVKK